MTRFSIALCICISSSVFVAVFFYPCSSSSVLFVLILELGINAALREPCDCLLTATNKGESTQSFPPTLYVWGLSTYFFSLWLCAFVRSVFLGALEGSLIPLSCVCVCVFTCMLAFCIVFLSFLCLLCCLCALHVCVHLKSRPCLQIFTLASHYCCIFEISKQISCQRGAVVMKWAQPQLVTSWHQSNIETAMTLDLQHIKNNHWFMRLQHVGKNKQNKFSFKAKSGGF